MRRRSIAPTLTLAALAATAAAPAAQAAWSASQTLARPAAEHLAAAGNARGEEVFAWAVTTERFLRSRDRRSGFASYVRARVRLADGTLGSTRAISSTKELVANPAVALDARGNATAVWTQAGRHHRIMVSFRPRDGRFGDAGRDRSHRRVHQLAPAGRRQLERRRRDRLERRPADAGRAPAGRPLPRRSPARLLRRAAGLRRRLRSDARDERRRRRLLRLGRERPRRRRLPHAPADRGRGARPALRALGADHAQRRRQPAGGRDHAGRPCDRRLARVAAGGRRAELRRDDLRRGAGSLGPAVRAAAGLTAPGLRAAASPRTRRARRSSSGTSATTRRRTPTGRRSRPPCDAAGGGALRIAGDAVAAQCRGGLGRARRRCERHGDDRLQRGCRRGRRTPTAGRSRCRTAGRPARRASAAREALPAEFTGALVIAAGARVTAASGGSGGRTLISDYAP